MLAAASAEGSGCDETGFTPRPDDPDQFEYYRGRCLVNDGRAWVPVDHQIFEMTDRKPYNA
jgi:hypothetical protein